MTRGKALFLGLGLLGLAILALLTIALIFPLTMLVTYPLISRQVSEMGLNPYAVKAITLLVTFLLAYLLTRFVFSLRSEDRVFGIAMLVLLVFSFNIGMAYHTRGTRWLWKNPITGEINTSSSPRKGPDEIAKPVTDESVAVLREDLGEHLSPKGEVDEDILRYPDNVAKIPWFNQKTGQPLFYYCAESDNRIRVFAWDGFCAPGEKRKPFDKAVKELLYRRAVERQGEKKKKAEAESAVKQALAQIHELRNDTQAKLSESAIAQEAKDKELAAANKASSDQLKALEADIKRVTEALPTAASVAARVVDEFTPELNSVHATLSETQARVLRLEKQRLDAQEEETLTEEMNPAELVMPASASPSPLQAHPPKPKPKANVIVLDACYDREYENRFMEFRVAEKNGVDAVFNSYTLSIWRRASASEPLEVTKRKQPLRFDRQTLDWGVKGRAELKKHFDLSYYRQWLERAFEMYVWVEMVFHGRDANGYPQELTVAAGSR